LTWQEINDIFSRPRKEKKTVTKTNAITFNPSCGEGWSWVPVPMAGEPSDSRGWPGRIQVTLRGEKLLAWQIFYNRNPTCIEAARVLVLGRLGEPTRLSDARRSFKVEPIPASERGEVREWLRDSERSILSAEFEWLE
jgi:hypothetical protein